MDGARSVSSGRATGDHTLNMAELIAIPLKKPSDVDVVKPLTNVIRSTYSGTGKDYADAIAEFSKLRNNALWRAFEKYESSLQVIYRYESSRSIVVSIVRATCRAGRRDFADGTSDVSRASLRVPRSLASRASARRSTFDRSV